MIRSEHLTLLFASILGELALSGCTGPFGSCPEPEPQVHEVDAADLESALEDGELSYDECLALCRPATGGGTTGDDTTGDDTTGDDTTGDDTTGEETTGLPTTSGTDSDGSTGSTTDTTGDPTTGDPTTGDSTTGDSNTGDSTTGDPTTGDPTTSGSSASSGDSATAGSDFGFIGCEAIEGESAKVRCEYNTFCVGGRRPAGLRSEGRGVGGAPLARWLAEAAHLEAASVPAFERLAAELAEHGAPTDLVAAALRAAEDERRHAALVGDLAVRAGGTPCAPEVPPTTPRTLLAIALENGVEGCVGETWAALLAAHQAEAAGDPSIRACMATIAADEARHAALAWAIDAWLLPQLSADERARVEHARRGAALALRGSGAPAPDLVDRAGLPPAPAARHLWRRLDEALWRAAA